MQIYVRMTDLETGSEWTWTREKFLNRKFVMQEMYEKYQDGEDFAMPPVSCCLILGRTFSHVHGT